MAFPRRYLHDDEEIVLDLHPHWRFFSCPAAILVLAATAAVLVASRVKGDLLRPLLAASLGAVLLSVLWLGARYARWVTINFVVTTDRLIFRSGVFAKHGREIPLERVNDITFDQSFFERLLGSGDLVIESAGERGQQPFTDIPRPALVQNEIYRQIERADDRTADRRARLRQLSVPELLEALDDLRQRGVISWAEFEAKKTQLLERM